MQTTPSLIRWLLLLVLLACSLPAFAADEWSTQAERRLSAIQKEMTGWDKKTPGKAEVEKYIAETLEIRSQSDKCIKDQSEELEGLKAKLGAINEGEADATGELRKKKAELQADQKQMERRLALCRLLSLSTQDLQNNLQQQLKKILSRELLHRDSPVWEVLAGLVSAESAPATAKRLDMDPWPAVLASLTTAVLALPVAFLLGQMLLRRFPWAEDSETQSASRVVARMFGQRLPLIAVLAALGVGSYVGGLLPLGALFGALLLSLLLSPFLEYLVCQGDLRCGEGLPARLLMLLTLFASAALLVNVDDYLPRDLFLLSRAGFMAFLAGSALWLLLRLSRRNDYQTLRALRLPLVVMLMAGPVAEWAGYRALGEYLLLGCYGTLIGLFIAWLLFHFSDSLLDWLHNVDKAGEPSREGGSDEESEASRTAPVITLLRWFTVFGLFIGLGYWMTLVWQFSPAQTAALDDWMRRGFQVGAVTIVPARLLTAAVAFLVLLTLARWLRRQLSDRWLTHTRLDPGARQSIVSLTSYTIIGLALLTTLSMAGLDFSNLAIIAGALSVGIGFGLQNIVNNFVSGLILLFERPVRPGDWVVVGNTEGHVRKVGIRYTLIRTFDRADVMVPNSELIANQVTNWMLQDVMGRVIVPLGVAYGTDVRKVRDILNRVAREHPFVLTRDPRVPAPWVLFMGFGDSSLDFELRCFIKDVNYRLSVRSDLLFAINDAFLEAGIEIPFPQRVVHMVGEPPEEDMQPEKEPQ